jgi:hypothetical protein
MARIKSSAKPITLLMNGNDRITDPTAMEAHVVGYFQKKFGSTNN